MDQKGILSLAHFDGTWQVFRISSITPIPPSMEQPFSHSPSFSLHSLYPSRGPLDHLGTKLYTTQLKSYNPDMILKDNSKKATNLVKVLDEFSFYRRI